MTETFNPYSPVTRPPKNPSIRTRKTSKDRMQNNLNSLTQQKRMHLSSHTTSTSTHITIKDGPENALNRVSNLEKTLTDRSSSLENLTVPSSGQHRRSLSASNLHALADPDLSIKAAISKKAYDKPHTSFSREKAVFTAWTQKYYHQLTIGCGATNCTNIFCKSSSRKRHFDARMAALVSIELAGHRNHYLCVKDKKRQAAKVLDSKTFELEENEIVSNDKKVGSVPFLYTFYSMSPFRSLFLPCPLTPSGLGLHKTHSASELDTPPKSRCDQGDNDGGDDSSLSSAMKNHLSSITSTISSSFNNIFKMASSASATEEKLSLSLLGEEKEKKLKNDETLRNTTRKTDDSNVLGRESENEEENIITRTRIPSVRIFGTEHAVDTEIESQPNIDQFEAEVAQEFRQHSIDDDDVAGGGSLDDDDDDDVVAQQADGNDDDEQESDGFSLTHLTLDMFNNVLLNYKECKDETFLLNTLRTVFSSWDALNMSFKDEGLRSKASSVARFPFDVKVSNVVEVFALLETVENADKFKTLLTDTIQVMLMKKQRTRGPHDLKPFVIIMAMPYLFEYVHVVYELAAAIHMLPDQCLEVLARFLAECFDADQLRAFVLGIKSQIKSESVWNSPTLGNRDSRVVCLCKTMQLFYNANNYHGNHQPILPNATFYCEHLTSKIDFKQAYSFWKRMLISGLSTSNSILNYPFLLEPAVKVQVIHIDAITQMREEYQDAIVHQARVQQVQKSWSDFNDSSKMSHEVRSAMCPYLLLEIRREKLIEDTLKQLQEKNTDLKKPLKIKYTSGGEQGLDMGGLQKEFFQVIVETVFDSGYELFSSSEDGHAVWFNTSFSSKSNVMFELVGILLGLAIYNGIILDVHFPLLVYKKLLGHTVNFDDLYEIQPTLAGGFKQLLRYVGDVENDFFQTFEVFHTVHGNKIEVELVPDGKNIPVTNDNRESFVELYVDFILNKSVHDQFEAFKKGFYQVCNGPTIKLFTPPELELLVCGNPDLDFKALESVTEYRDGYTKEHPLMKDFWQIVHKFTFQQKQALLMFVTGSYRVPLKGLGAMSFYIQRNGPDSNNLPTSMTCFNRLLLPQYRSVEKLEHMLLLAIENSKGFGLT